MYTRKEEMKAVAETILQISEPQKGKFIGAYGLCASYEFWKIDIMDEIDQKVKEMGFKKEAILSHYRTINTFFKDFEEQVKGEIVDEGDFFDENDEGEGELDDRFNMETVYPCSVLKKTTIEVPEGFTHFMILPVDYNRNFSTDIGIAWMTRKGKKNYSQYLTGDY
jgi:hypothetical protein